jgi:hypothetical protein
VAGGLIEMPALRGRFIPGLAGWAVLGAVPVAGAAIAWWQYRREQRTRFLASLAASALCMLTLLGGWAILTLDECKAPRTLVAEADACQTRRDVAVACLHLEHLPSLNFYCKRDIKHLRTNADMALMLDHPLPVYLFMPAETWNRLEKSAGATLKRVASHRDLYKNRDLVVVTNHGMMLPARFTSHVVDIP